MRVLVCGSRHFTNLLQMKSILQSIFDPDDTVTLIHGDATGADKLSEEALTGYFHGGFVVQRYPANWQKYGRAAGPIRNKQMLDEGKPDLVIAFLAPNSRGTKNMIELAQAANITVRIINV